MNAVRDLAAIHDERNWQPRSPADMTVAPAAYMGKADTDLVRGAGTYVVEDHRALELAILDKVGGVEHDDPTAALEATSWLMIELLHDDHPAARIKSAAILSQLAGAWVDRKGVRIPAVPLTGNLEAALRAIDTATDANEFLAAMQLLSAAPLPAGPEAVRVVVGASRTASAFGVGDDHRSALLLYTLGTRAVLSALDAGAQAADPEVAHACAERAALLRRFAVRG